MMKKKYSCNLCYEEKKAEQLIGLRFHSFKCFKFDYARQTDGAHICASCLKQIINQVDLANEFMEKMDKQ